MDITAVRQALAANLSTMLGTQVSPRMLVNPTPPAAHVFPAETDFDQTFGRGQDFQVLTVQVLVGTVSSEAAQDQLDAYLSGSGPQSVKHAVESDRTLGGACSDLVVASATGYRSVVQEGQAPVLVCEWRVEVRGSGT
jgi:hypothetical protein